MFSVLGQAMSQHSRVKVWNENLAKYLLGNTQLCAFKLQIKKIMRLNITEGQPDKQDGGSPLKYVCQSYQLVLINLRAEDFKWQVREYAATGEKSRYTLYHISMPLFTCPCQKKKGGRNHIQRSPVLLCVHSLTIRNQRSFSVFVFFVWE